MEVIQNVHDDEEVLSNISDVESDVDSELEYAAELYDELRYGVDYDLMRKATDINELFTRACYEGNLEVAKYIVATTHRRNNPIKELSSYEFARVCIYGHLAIAQWFYEIKPMILEDENSESNLMYAFSNSITENKYNVCEWLLTIRPTLNVLGDDTLLYLSEKGNVEGLRWLYARYPDLILSNTDHMVRYGSKKLDVIRFIDEIDPNYFTDENINMIQFFHRVCEKRMLDFVEWIHSKDPERYEYSILPDGSIYRPLKIKDETKSVAEIETCAICVDNPSNVITQCNHQFCSDCLHAWLIQKSKITCPCCRGRIKYSRRKNLYTIFKLVKAS